MRIGIETVRESWEAFAEAALPLHPAENQESEMRIAFYMGAWAIFHTIGRISAGDEAIAREHLELIYRELVDFVDLFRAERA